MTFNRFEGGVFDDKVWPEGRKPEHEVRNSET